MTLTPRTHSARSASPPPPTARPYGARGAAAELWRSRDGELVLSGPAGTGKSRACLEKLHFCALKYPGMRALIVRKTRESLTESALVTYEDKVIPEGSAIASGPQRRMRQAYHYGNGSSIVAGGLDKPGKIMSTEYDLIYVQEATELELDAWLALTTRLRNNKMPYQQLIADCNPDAPTHWLWLRSQSGGCRMLHSKHEDNPLLHDGRDWTADGRIYRDRLERLGILNPETGRREGTEYARLALGLWVQASGLVYDVWADGPEDGNVTEAAEYIPDAGPVYWAVDDGYAGELDPRTETYTANSHPRVFLLVQEAADGRLNVFAEDYATQLLPDLHLERVMALAYPEPDFAAIDSSAAELRGRLRAFGVGCYGKPTTVEESIKVARRLLGPDQNGWRRIRVHPRCKHLRAEMSSYRYDDKGHPLKQHDHGPDAIRYLCWKMRSDP